MNKVEFTQNALKKENKIFMYFILLTVVSSVLYAEEVNVENFIDNYSRLIRGIENVSGTATDARKRDILNNGKKRATYYESFFLNANQEVLEELINKGFEYLISSQGAKDKKVYIEYTLKIMSRLAKRYMEEFPNERKKLKQFIGQSFKVETYFNEDTVFKKDIETVQKFTNDLVSIYAKSADETFTKYNMALGDISREITIDRTAFDLVNLGNIKVAYSFPFGIIVLSPKENARNAKGENAWIDRGGGGDAWGTRDVLLKDDPKQMLSSKIISDFMGKDLIDAVVRNLSLMNLSGINFSTNGMYAGQIDRKMSVVIKYSFRLTPDKTIANNVVDNYYGNAEVNTVIQVRDNNIITGSQIGEVVMPSRDFKVACSNCEGSGRTDGIRRVVCESCDGTGNRVPTQNERSVAAAMGTGTYRFPCYGCDGSGSVGYRATVDCSGCDGTGKSIHRQTDNLCSDLNKLKTFLKITL